MGYFWTSCCIAVIRHAVSAYNLSSNMKIREHYIKFTGNKLSTIHISSTKQQYARIFQKQLRQCNFILKCKSNNSLVLQARTTNANKMLITQRLCAFLALAQLLRNFVFLFFCSFSFNLTDTCIASPSFFTLMRKKAT